MRPPPKRMSTRGRLTIAGVGFGVYAALTIFVLRGGGPVGPDRALLDLAVRAERPWLTEAVDAITLLGEATTLTVLALLAVVALVRVDRRSAIFVAASALGAGVFHYLLKWVIARPRPNAAEVFHPGHYSFPSGHSMGTFCLFVSVALVVRQIDHRKQVPVAIATAMLVAAVGMTRVYLGVHYPTDVLGGWAVGTLWLAILYAWYRRAFLATEDEPVVVTT